MKFISQEKMSLINTENENNEELYIYGSGEMDQLSPVKEDEKYEDIYDSKIPLKIPLNFVSPKEKIQTIKCGQMFTMILSSEGNVYTFGCAGPQDEEEKTDDSRQKVDDDDCHGTGIRTDRGRRDVRRQPGRQCNLRK